MMIQPHTAPTGVWLVPGSLDGELLRLDEPLSFWGGFDAPSGTIIDRSHPQCGTALTGKVVAMPGSRGSSGTPGVLGESLRLGTGPSGLIVTSGDVNLVAGALTAHTLYGSTCPILLVTDDVFAGLQDGAQIETAAAPSTDTEATDE